MIGPHFAFSLVPIYKPVLSCVGLECRSKQVSCFCCFEKESCASTNHIILVLHLLQFLVQLIVSFLRKEYQYTLTNPPVTFSSIREIAWNFPQHHRINVFCLPPSLSAGSTDKTQL